MWIAVVAAVVLVCSTAKTAQACFFTCWWYSGLIEVDNGEVYFYNGCTEEGTSITCYYTSALN